MANENFHTNGIRKRILDCAQRNKEIEPYTQLNTWSPIMAAKFAAGLHPAESRNKLPTKVIAFDRSGNTQSHEAKALRIFEIS